MKISLRLLKQKLNLIIVVTIGVAAGGITTAAVMAAEPDNNGQINACYDNTTQVLSANQDGSSCPAGSSALNWQQNGGPVVRDSNGHVVGKLTQYDPNNSRLQVYNYSLRRIIDIAIINGDYDFGGSGQYPPFFASSDCTGDPYIFDNYGLAAHTRLFEVGSGSYGIVPDSTAAQTFTYSSVLTYDSGSNAFNCVSLDPTTADTFYPVTAVSLPFTTPFAAPLSFE